MSTSTPSPDAYSAALLPLLARLADLPDFHPQPCRRWLTNQLFPATEAFDTPSPLALDAVNRLLAIDPSSKAWTTWCTTAWRLYTSPFGSRGLVGTALNEPGLEAITVGLVDAIRQVQARRAG